MRTNQYGQVFFSESEIFDALYSGQLNDLDEILIDTPDIADQYNRAIDQNYEKFSLLKFNSLIDKSIEEFDLDNQKQWLMPDSAYIDIEKYIYDQCKTDIEKSRVSFELELFKKNSMLDLLRYLKYLVDIMRQNNIVWGVGRGSCVASYCLFLIGVHKIDSIKYDLPISEFFKSNP